MKRVTEVRLTIAALIYAIEIDLKNCISKYITPYQKNFNFVGSQEVIDNMVRRFNKDNPSIEAEENKDEVLQYLDFGDFYRIIQSNKTFFPNSVILEVKDSIKSLEELSSVRNRVMHTRPLLSGDFSKAYAFAKEKESNNLEIWHSLQLTLSKIEEDPSYVLTLSIPTIKSTEFDIQHNLPIPDFDETGFIGRKKDAENVLKLILGNNRVVSIIGDGGIGKTALALKVAYDILDLKDKNPFDIIIWVSAKTTMLTAHGIKTIENSLVDYGGLLEGLIEGVGESSSVQNSLNTIIEYLDLFETLIIVDNLETILDEKIREFIRDAQKKCKILITSRIGLGELEFRSPLEGMSESESMVLIRQLASLKKTKIIENLPNQKLNDIAKKLHYNPLALKWFVNSVETGLSPNEVLNNTEDLLNFCLTNVYEKLSEDAKNIVRTILASRKDLNDAEIIFLTKIPTLVFRRTLNELFATTFINRIIEVSGNEQELKYTIPEFAKQYILSNHPIESAFIKRINSEMKQLNISASNIKRQSEYNEFGVNAIAIRNTNEKIIARLLNEALRFSKVKNVQDALLKIKEAISIKPDYFETYRVSAFIKATYDDLLGAENDYQTGLEMEPGNPRLLYFYGSFLLYNLNDIERAFECALEVYKQRPESQYPALLLSRILNSQGEYEKSQKILLTLLEKKDVSKTDQRIINTDLMSMYSYWGKDILDKVGDFPLAISKYLRSIQTFETSVNSSNSDERMNKVFCNVLKSFIQKIPVSQNKENIEFIKELFIKYDDNITTNDSREYLRALLFNSYGISFDKRTVLSGEIVKAPKNDLFSFIKSDNGKEYYAHMKAYKYKSDFDHLLVGMKVDFEIGNNNLGECAINIEVKESATNSSFNGHNG